MICSMCGQVHTSTTGCPTVYAPYPLQKVGAGDSNTYVGRACTNCTALSQQLTEVKTERDKLALELNRVTRGDVSNVITTFVDALMHIARLEAEQRALKNIPRCDECGAELVFMGYYAVETLGGPDVRELMDCPVCKIKEERDALRSVCAQAYQLAGLVGAPVRVLDALGDGANGEIGKRFKGDFLPITLNECDEIKDARRRGWEALREMALFSMDQIAAQLRIQVLICKDLLMVNTAYKNKIRAEQTEHLADDIRTLEYKEEGT